ncbi:MAG: radical SAM protein [Bacillota bacterium]|jgi:pyruvate-formate lyase-activating enzyme
MERINLVYTDAAGELREEPELTAVGLNGWQVEVADEGWIDLPVGAELVSLPGRLPLGYNEATAEVEAVEGAIAVAALLPMGFTRCLLPGYEVADARELPLFGYTAVGAAGGQLKVAALKTDAELKWNPVYYNTADLPQLIAHKETAFPANRILRQLARCAREYHCLTAQNMFYQRWEAGIPVSPHCNADCLGCISKQPAECCPAPQSRIDFVPTVTEVAELAAAHLETATAGIVSFGQGCEGEPSLQYRLIAAAIREIRRQTGRGTINMNSNAGYCEAIRQLTAAGLDSIRVSLFSARPQMYRWYHRPQGYRFDDVVQSLRLAADQGLMVAVNLLFYPGFTNQEPETEAFYNLLAHTGIQQVQLRNLNLDPEKLTPCLTQDELGTVADWLTALKAEFPKLRIGNYSIPKHEPGINKIF